MTKITKATTLTVGGVLAAAFLLASGVLADTRDAAYCNAVVQKYERYVAGGSAKSRPSVGLESRHAVEQCKAGDMSGIAVIEKALENAKVPLPPRG